MRNITEHQFLRNEQGKLTLLLDVVSFEEAEEPVFFVSKNENKAYLRRAPGDVHQIVGIHADIIEDVRKTDSVVILELLGEAVSHSYLVQSSVIDENDDQPAKA